MNTSLLSKLSVMTEEEQLLLAGGPLETALYLASGSHMVDSNILLSQGDLIAIRPHPRFIDFPMHTHNYVEIVYMCKGSTTHIIDGKRTLTLRRGELLFMSRHVRHAIKRAGVDDVAVNFIVMPQFFDAALEMIGGDNVMWHFLVDGLKHKGGDISYLHFSVADIPAIQNTVESMLWSLIEPRANDRRICRAAMGLLCLQLLSHTEHLAMDHRRSDRNTLVMESLREVEENYKEANLRCVADRHGVSLAYLCQLIRASTGRTYKELLRQKRLSQAARLLCATSLSVREIIHAVGYENTSYFYGIFQDAYHMRPSDYRKENRPSS